MSRRGGFTLLEVMVAIFVFAIIMGTLLTLVQQNLARLGRARLETEAARLAEEHIRELQQAASDEFPEVGTDEGTFEPPHDGLRWVSTIEPYSVALPVDKEERAGSSSVFALGDSEPSLRRVIVRIFPEDGETELIDPFVTFLVTPLEPGNLPNSLRGGTDEDER
ncbi:MAG: type II secretion system protein [Deltaproteobacteria bacterium]|nr:type II secretion system protein [Deltaproteobacteria bacterium]